MGQCFGMAIRCFPDDHVGIGFLIDGLLAIAAKNDFGHRLFYLKKPPPSAVKIVSQLAERRLVQDVRTSSSFLWLSKPGAKCWPQDRDKRVTVLAADFTVLVTMEPVRGQAVS